LTGANVVDADLDELKPLHWLRDLRLDRNPISSAGLERLKVLPQLEALSIRETQVAQREAATFREARPHCSVTWSADSLINAMINESYDLRRALRSLDTTLVQDAKGDVVEVRLSGVTDEGVRHLAALTSLRVLDLHGEERSYAAITDKGLAHLRGLRNLQSLSLAKTLITSAGLVHLTELKELWHLGLNDTAIGDDGLPYLKKLPKLRQLNLRLTEITDACIEQCKEMKTLEYLVLDSTAVSATAGNSLREHLPRCSIMHSPSLRK
jgi:Leucine-rich repeat (LRR) protein